MEPPKIWREKKQRYLGIGIICEDCNQKSFPFSKSCPFCSGQNVEEYEIARTGKISTFTRFSDTSKDKIKNLPYIIGIIKLEDGISVTAQIVDCEYADLKEGTKVRMVFRILSKDGKEGLISYGFKFTPI